MTVLIGFSCDDSSSENEIICIEQFEHIVLKVQYEDGSPVALDSFKVFWEEQEVTIKYNDYEYQMARKVGLYAVVNDGMRNELKGLQENFRFAGYIEDELVISENVLVGANECHVCYYGEKPLIITLKDQ